MSEEEGSEAASSQESAMSWLLDLEVVLVEVFEVVVRENLFREDSMFDGSGCLSIW